MKIQLLAAGLVGQSEAVERLTAALERILHASLPRGVVLGCGLFAGPTGSGKTEAAKLLHRALGGDTPLARIDCSEFSDASALRLLLGERDGSPGRIEQQRTRCPNGVFLFDEIEKGSREAQMLLLQILDEGWVTTGAGLRLEFRDLFVVATTNLGSAEIVGKTHLPFPSLERHVTAACESHLRPELLARFGMPYVFRPLGRAEQETLVRRRVDFLVGHALDNGRRVVATADAVEFLAARGFSRRHGARRLFQFIDEAFGDALVRSLKVGHGGNGRLVPQGDQLEVLP